MGSRLILVFILLLVVAVTKGIRSTCNVKVETRGTSADIVCNFSTDVSAVINDFQVDHFQVNGSSRRQETVFVCEKTQGKTECIHRPGYQLQGIVSETVTLKIPELSQEHAGQYMCSVIPSDPSEVQMCDLPSEVIALGAPVRMDVDKRISDESTGRQTSTLVNQAQSCSMHIFFTMVSPETSSRVFVFACFILLQTGPLIQALRSECMVDRQGTSALVTCIFDTDVSKLPNDFQVDRIRADDAISNQETVFLCHKSQGKFEYTQRPGYMLIGTVSTNVTLRISNVTQAYAEKYLCAVIPSDPSEVRLCELKLKETVAESDDTTDQITDSPARTVKNKESASIDLPIVIGLSVAIPLLIAFLVTLFCIIYRKRNARKGSQSEEQPFNDPETPVDSIAND